MEESIFRYLEPFTRDQGRLHNGRNVARCIMAKIGGGDFLMIMMLLLVSIIIYYYINTFITLHQSTFNLVFAFFSISIYQLSLHANSA